MKKTILLILALLSITIAGAQKREMRGAWIQCVNGQFQGLGTARMQQTLTYQLDELKKDGVNVIIFQVRGTACMDQSLQSQDQRYTPTVTEAYRRS